MGAQWFNRVDFINLANKIHIRCEQDQTTIWLFNLIVSY